MKKISKPLTNQGSIQRGALQPQFNTAPALDTTTLLAHKYINAESNTNKIASTGQADVKSSFLSRTGAESVRSQTIASVQVQNIPKPFTDQQSIQRWVLQSSVNTAPSSDTTTSPSNLGTATSTPQTTSPHHDAGQNRQQKTEKWLTKNWDSIISTLTFVLVLVGSICAPISTYRSGTANQKNYESFRLTQWRNCIDLGVSRATLRILNVPPEN